MTDRSIATAVRILAIATALTLLWTPSAIAQDNDSIIRVYKPRFLDVDAGYMLAIQVCGGRRAMAEDGRRCQVETLGDDQFIVEGPEDAHEEFSNLLRERDIPPATQEFRVILLRADRGDNMPDLPRGAREAVADLQTVMPFTGFHVIDSGWLRTSAHASTSLGEMGTFSVDLDFIGSPLEDPALLVEFRLNFHPVLFVGQPEGEDAASIQTPAVQYGDWRGLISSSFGIRVGETVVVGTSRVNGGDEAVVALLTAIERQ